MALLSSFLDVTKICRLCLSHDRPLTSMFAEGNTEQIISTGVNSLSIPSKILACVRIVVSCEDNFPDKICNRCTEQIENWSKFKDLCDNANTLLLQFAAGMCSLTDKTSDQRNSFADDVKQLDLPETLPDLPETLPDFTLEDDSFLDQAPFLEKNDSKEDLSDSMVQDSLSLILSDCGNIQNDLPDLKESEDKEKEESKKEENRTRMRQNYFKLYAKNYKCEFCSSVFTKFNNLLLHDRTEHINIAKEAICTKCNQAFLSTSRLDYHTQLKHKEKSFECDVCGMKSVSEKSLKVHKLRHSGKFICNICRTVTSSQSSLEDHLRIHSSERTYQCQICDQAFKQRQSLQHHMKTHNVNSKSNFDCKICLCSFENIESLKEHKTVHNENKSLICEVCGSVFKSQSSLSVHRLKHEDKKHVCSVCDKEFFTKNLLNRHMLIHFARPFVCEVCDKSFNRADTLSLHMKTHNTLQKFECTICGQTFKLNKYLKRHLVRIHDEK